jgi:UDP-N-acetyl-D-galactosamine dehydrogenase
LSKIVPQRKIGVIGLGYVGLPVALAFAKKFPNTVGFDINLKKVKELSSGIDITGEIEKSELSTSTIKFTADKADLKDVDFFVVAVPTPVDQNRNPDLTPLEGASTIVGSVLKKGTIVVYESTVYPGVTEEYCGPILEKVSGLKAGNDFFLGYSPERINPGDKEHTLERITKVVSGDNPATLEIVAEVYGAVVTAGVFKAASIKVAEAAKVIENTQRDLNISLMNELALIFDRIGIRTKDVLDAASTKWNFLRFSPGLVGGHCIGVDPYYLTTKAEELGYHPQVITAGRRINDGMGAYLASKLVKLLSHSGVPVKSAKVGVLGITFKENVSDIRNSRVPDIINELKEYGIIPVVHDPLADPEGIKHEYGLELTSLENFSSLDAVVFAVSHREYLQLGFEKIASFLKTGGVFMDIKSQFSAGDFKNSKYWSL